MPSKGGSVMHRNCSAKLGCKVNATPARKVLKSSLFGPRTKIVHLCVADSSISIGGKNLLERKGVVRNKYQEDYLLFYLNYKPQSHKIKDL